MPSPVFFARTVSISDIKLSPAQVPPLFYDQAFTEWCGDDGVKVGTRQRRRDIFNVEKCLCRKIL